MKTLSDAINRKIVQNHIKRGRSVITLLEVASTVKGKDGIMILDEIKKAKNIPAIHGFENKSSTGTVRFSRYKRKKGV